MTDFEHTHTVFLLASDSQLKTIHGKKLRIINYQFT